MRFSKFLLLCCLWLLALLVPELVARVFMPEWSPAQENTRTMIPDREVGWLYKAHAEADTARLSGTFVANSLGLRAAELGDKDKPRVVFLGDSFTWGWGVPDGVRYTDRLQLAYPQYQIINAGINGYSTVQETLLLKKYYQQMMPDLVVLQVFQNDFIENLENRGVYPKPYLDWHHDFVLKHPPPGMAGDEWISHVALWIANHTYFYRQVVIAAYAKLMRNDFPEAEMPSDEKILVHAMGVALDSLIGFCREKNIPLMIISSDLKPYQQQAVDVIAREKAILHYDLSQSAFKDKQHFALGDHTAHWNAYGHQLVADVVGPVMDKKLRTR